MRKNQLGFSAVLAVLVLLVASVVGAVVYRVIKDDSAGRSSELEAVNNAETGFVEIDEWGVKIDLRDYDKVQFEIKHESGQTMQGDAYEEFAEPSFKSEFIQDETCEPGLSLFRSRTSFASESQKKVGDYYYFIAGGPGPCSDDPENNPDDLLKGRFLKDFDTRKITSLAE